MIFGILVHDILRKFDTWGSIGLHCAGIMKSQAKYLPLP